MKTAFVFLITFFFFHAQAQDLERVDASLQLYPSSFREASELSAMIGRDFLHKEEQLRAIYGWIINNIAYDPTEYRRFDYSFKNYRERNKKEEKTRQQIIRYTIREGKAVCEGYAMLFEKLCNDLGIENYLVRGDIKTHFNDIGRPFKRIHMWNIAVLNGKPFLFDTTWGAGKYRDRFIKEPSYFYYKTPPELFVNTHFPAIDRDSLLKEPFSREAFQSWPLIIAQGLSIDKVVSPKNGLLDSRSVDGAFDFALNIGADTRISCQLDGETQEVVPEEREGLMVFSVPFRLGQSELLILFNERPALAYKIK